MIETNRLILKPLSYEQLIKYIRTDRSLETELGVNHVQRVISPELQEALEQTILPNVADTSKNYLFSTLWTLIAKDINMMVGDICIVGEPNAEGEIEIGYGTYQEFENKGFMTEAVGGIIGWAKTQANVRAVCASTEKQNSASFRVLIKNNFVKIAQNESLFYWKLTL